MGDAKDQKSKRPNIPMWAQGQHPLLVHLPMGLWIGAAIFDLTSRAGFGGNAIVQLSFWAILGGLGMAVIAIPAGIIDWLGIKREKPAWKMGLYHLLLNVIVVVLFAVNAAIRCHTFTTAPIAPVVPTALSVLAVLILLPSAWLGGRMVYDQGIGVARKSKKELRKMAEASGANVPPSKAEKS